MAIPVQHVPTLRKHCSNFSAHTFLYSRPSPYHTTTNNVILTATSTISTSLRNRLYRALFAYTQTLYRPLLAKQWCRKLYESFTTVCKRISQKLDYENLIIWFPKVRILLSGRKGGAFVARSIVVFELFSRVDPVSNPIFVWQTFWLCRKFESFRSRGQFLEDGDSLSNRFVCYHTFLSTLGIGLVPNLCERACLFLSWASATTRWCDDSDVTDLKCICQVRKL